MEEIRADRFEFGVIFEEGRLYEVQKAFWMKTCDGPLVVAKPGEIVFLSQNFGNEMFLAGRVIPQELPEYYEALHDFQTIGPDGCYIRVKRGDVVRLSKDEVVRFLRSGDVKPKKGGIER